MEGKAKGIKTGAVNFEIIVEMPWGA